MTQVPATATTNAPKYQIDKCKATRSQHKTRSPSILHPAKKAANYATPRCLLLLPVSNRTAITTTNSSPLLFCVKDAPAITTATNATFSLQLIVESFSTGTNSSLLLFCVKDAPAIMMVTHADYSLQLIVESLFTGAKQVASATIPNESFKLIVKYTKTSLHFREDCGTFCEGEWVQHR